MGCSTVNPRPEESTRACSLDTRVVSAARVCDEHTLLELLSSEAPDSAPGQFLQVLCGSPRQLADNGNPSSRSVFLRRPFSIADQWRDNDGVHIRIISRAVGRGTAWLETLAPGDIVNITGPLGRGFRIPADDVPVALVGGGVGIPPLLYLARRLHEAGRRDVTAIFGATTRGLLPLRFRHDPPPDASASQCVKLPGGADYPTSITTDDGSYGTRGVVTDAVRRWADQRSPDQLSRGVLFACGPDAMLRAVATTTRELGLACQLSIERNMGCGLGTCLSCVVRVSDETRSEGWRWAQTCTDGPVFDRDELRCWD